MIRNTLAAILVAGLTAPAFGADLTKGTVKSIDPAQNKFVIKDAKGQDATFQCTAECKFICPTDKVKEREKPDPTASRAKLADLKVGDTISIAYEKRGDDLQAMAVLKHDGDYRDAFLGLGKVKEAAAANAPLTVTDMTGKDMRFRVTDDVQVQIDGRDSKANDLKSGDQVLVVYQKVGDEFRAKEICSMRAGARRDPNRP
jgi:Cu/Ag efflux protein CusF